MANERDQEILDAYEAWDPDERTVATLVEELDISRQRLYDVLERNAVVPKSRRQSRTSRGGVGVQDDLLAEMAEMALGYLLRQLQEARDEISQYREKYGPL